MTICVHGPFAACSQTRSAVSVAEQHGGETEPADRLRLSGILAEDLARLTTRVQRVYAGDHRHHESSSPQGRSPANWIILVTEVLPRLEHPDLDQRNVLCAGGTTLPSSLV